MPSPYLVPSAAAANAFTRPSAANSRCRETPQKSTAAPSPSPHRPRQITLPGAQCDDIAYRIATNDDEQAVSTDTAGPCSPNTYDTRPEATLIDVPVNPHPCSPRYPYCRNCRENAVPPVAEPRNDNGSIRVPYRNLPASTAAEDPSPTLHQSDAEEPGVKAGGVVEARHEKRT